MSMLAERKVKQRWTLNPRGKAWSEDSNKFGQKLMEKMGWSKGKGLGAKEDGIVEHVKPSYKNDSRGMGYKETNNQWTEHDSNFTALLQSLSDDKTPERAPIASLEQKSQNSRVRVHYKKFTRGKDLSRCSEKDLAQIFGKKSLKSEVTPSSSSSQPKEEEETKESSFIYNGGSMVDYFKKKIPNFGKQNSYVVGSNGVLKCHSETESEEERPGFGCENKRKRNLLENEEISKVMSPSIKQAKKKKRELEEAKGMSNPAFDPLFGNVQVQKHVLNTIEEEDEDTVKKNLDLEASLDDRSRGKNEDEKIATKKNKIKGDVETREDDSGIDNSSDDSQRPKKGKKLICTIEETQEERNDNALVVKKKKKKKVEVMVPSLIENINLEISSSSLNDNSGIGKKKIKNEEGIENPNFNPNQIERERRNDVLEVKRKKIKNKSSSLTENINLDVSSSSSNDSSKVQKKKKIKNENQSCGIENPNFDNVDDDSSSQNSKFEVKRKKKNEENATGIENPSFGTLGNRQEVCRNNDFEVTRKKKRKSEEMSNGNFDSPANGCHGGDFEVKRKKKKRQDLGVENPIFDEEESQTSYNNNDFEVKRKKKKNPDESFAIDNPNFDSRDDCPNSYVDTNFEVKRKKKKKKNDLALENPNFEDSIDEGQVNQKEEILEKNSTSKKKKKEDNANCEDSIDQNKEVVLKDTAEETEELGFDLMLNITSIPTVPKPEKSSKSSTKRRKSVRFSEVNEERIIPNEDVENRKELFDINSKVIEAGLDEISKKIDGFQAEIENDINQAKLSKFIGEVGNPKGENEKLPNGTKLKFKYARFGRTPWYHNKNTSRAQTSYKHLIKGDIVLEFNNTNLHEIVGYGVKKVKK